MNSSTSSTQTMRRTIHLGETQIDELLDRLDAEESPTKPRPGSDKVFPYRIKRLCVTLEQSGGTAAQFQVVARTLSGNNVSFLHGGYVHVGTYCEVQLISLYGAWDDIPGLVISCRYVEANIHEVVTRFHRHIDVALYNRAAIRTRVLLAEDEPISANIAIYHLGTLNATVDHVENGQLAVEKALSNNYDLILMDIDMPVMDGLAATKELRSQGYIGMIAAVTAHTQEEMRRKCRESGCDRYIAKPYSHEDLAGLMDSLADEPLYSTLADRKDLVPTIDAFVAELPASVRTLEEALVKHDTPSVVSVARKLKGDGSACGFEPITEAAAKIEADLIAGATVDSLNDRIAALTKLCRSAHPTR